MTDFFPKLLCGHVDMGDRYTVSEDFEALRVELARRQSVAAYNAVKLVNPYFNFAKRKISHWFSANCLNCGTFFQYEKLISANKFAPPKPHKFCSKHCVMEYRWKTARMRAT